MHVPNLTKTVQTTNGPQLINNAVTQAERARQKPNLAQKIETNQ